MPEIYEKTPAGRQALSTRQPLLDRPVRTLLLLVDGRKSDAELLDLLSSQDLGTKAFETLHELGLIAPCSQMVDEPTPVVLDEQPEPSAAPKNPEKGRSLWAQLSGSVLNVLQMGTMTPRERVAGLAEVIKCAVVADPTFVEWLENNLDAVVAGDATAEAQMVKRTEALHEKIEISDRVERRNPPYQDFGWTMGKVVESLLGYGHFLRGEALALGMILATDIGVIQGTLSESAALRVLTLLKRSGLPTRVPRTSAARWLQSLPLDNTGAVRQLDCVLIKDIGEPLSMAVSRSIVVEALERAGALVG
ncbi:MAG: hypothetical protein WCA24_00660 [Thiomonas sp.]